MLVTQENIRFRTALFVWGFMFCVLACQNPIPPNDEEFPIYVNNLNQGFDIGVDSSERQRGWLIENNGVIQMNYPANQKWGSVFVVAGAVALEEVGEDFSNYSTLAVELKGSGENEFVMVSIEDRFGSPGKAHFALNITESWQTYLFSLLDFGRTDLKNLHVVSNFSFTGQKAQTVYFRNIKFLRENLVDTYDSAFYIFFGGHIVPGYELGIAKDTLSTNPDQIEVEISSGELNVNYPPGNEWGAVFFYQPDCIPQDFSVYTKLVFQLKAQSSSSPVYIGIRNCSNYPDDVRIHPRSSWQSVTIPLTDYPFTRIEKLTTLFSITFLGSNSQTVSLRDIRFVR